jgi:hypothetical protein
MILFEFMMGLEHKHDQMLKSRPFFSTSSLFLVRVPTLSSPFAPTISRWPSRGMAAFNIANGHYVVRPAGHLVPD